MSRKYQVKAYLPESEKNAFAQYCIKQGRSESEVVRQYIRRVVAQEKGKK